jgi:hypothetical protein
MLFSTIIYIRGQQMNLCCQLPAAENSAANQNRGCKYGSSQTTVLANFGRIFFKKCPCIYFTAGNINHGNKPLPSSPRVQIQTIARKNYKEIKKL